ncbi:type II toxin-antitoxin system VapC family toxin [Dyadobacter sp. NIV53]|uniref:type II toxin-antitoxin system VapC family toxin n=1 Tax=Dyadobacter sp. NIV53 TaxID=2861765 RepID=UPI001C8872B4|nr:type II toxin-antitoxin system VapC family toxin [Dyadobacter sp. NIV53]
MAYLLDTHVILWALDEESRLSATAKSIIINIDSACFVNIISFFEIAIKKKIGKLELTKSINEYITEIERIGIILLPIKKEYLDSYDQISLLPNHRDPFDRLILATAFSEKFTLISADEKFYQYNNIIEVVW